MSTQGLSIAFRSAQRKSAVAAVMAAVAGVFLTLALAFGAYAGFLVLATRFPAEQAALIVAGVALAIAVLAALVGWFAIRSAEKRVTSAIKTSALAVVGPSALTFAARNTRLAGAAAALAVGLFAARRAKG